MIVLIPSYKPDFRLPELINQLQAEGVERIIVIDDGNGSEFAPVYDQVRAMGAVVLVHQVNCGKGRGIKTGFEYILKHYPGEGAVIADSDGQHLCADIIATGKTLDQNPDAMILGTRKFDGDVPFRSQLGNSITRAVFLWATGCPVADTQTGLRGVPHALMSEIIAMKGERYELEINMLLFCAKKKVPFIQVPIETVYLDGNKGSHFNPLKDSVRIYKIIILFSIMSILAMFADIGVFMLAATLLAGVLEPFWLIIASVAAGRVAAFGIKRRGQKSDIIEWKDELIKLVAYSAIVLLLSISGGMWLLWARVLASSITGLCFMIVLNERARHENIFAKMRSWSLKSAQKRDAGEDVEK